MRQHGLDDGVDERVRALPAVDPATRSATGTSHHRQHHRFGTTVTLALADAAASLLLVAPLFGQCTVQRGHDDLHALGFAEEAIGKADAVISELHDMQLAAVVRVVLIAGRGDGSIWSAHSSKRLA